MEELKNELPVEYIHEAMKLKEEWILQTRELLKNNNNIMFDANAKEERKINQKFNDSLKKLQQKYNIK